MLETNKFLLLVRSSSWPGPFTFAFTAQGTSTTLSGRTDTTCNGAVTQHVTANGISIGILSDQYSGVCYPYDGYSDGDFAIVAGTFADHTGNSYYAFKISPAQKTATSFLASKALLYVKGPATLSVVTYSGSFAQMAPVASNQAWTASTLYLNGLTSDLTVLLLPSTMPFKGEWQTFGNTKAAKLHTDNEFTLFARSVPVTGSPFNPSDYKTGFDRYGSNKKFFTVFDGATDGVLWQDTSDSNIYLTWFSADFSSTSTYQLPTVGKSTLVCGAGDGNGNVAYITYQTANAADSVTKLPVHGYKVSKTGAVLATQVYDTATTGLNIYSFSPPGGSMAWDVTNSKIAVIISRTMLKGSDGLNHQGAIAVFLDGNTMAVLQNTGQTSGHSFANSLLKGNTQFIGADLGDNYPRGINLHTMDPSALTRSSKLVYQFKTQHCKPTAPETCCFGICDVNYVDSADGKNVIKQSNDNEVYTELAHGGVVEVDNGQGLLVLFAGEKAPLDNKKVGAPGLNAPRDLGYVKISSDFKTILSGTNTEQGSFYTFGGTLQPQVNVGVQWHTSSASIEDNVSRIKCLNSSGRVLVMYERWSSTAYISTHIMALAQTGQVMHAARQSSASFRLPLTDEVTLTSAGTAIWYTGSYGTLTRYEMSFTADNYSPPLPPSPGSSSSAPSSAPVPVPPATGRPTSAPTSAPTLAPTSPCANKNCNGHGTCEQATGVCVCTGGYSGVNCEVVWDACLAKNCSGHGSCAAGVCSCVADYVGTDCFSFDPCTYRGAPCGPGTCTNNGTSINCNCAGTAYGGTYCEVLKPTCSDKKINQGETDVDCGGPCPACMTCFDKIKNQDEVGVDCGGVNCVRCPTCGDGTKNGDETGIDCGGSCSSCTVAPTCTDGAKNGNETGIDCGGPCPNACSVYLWQITDWSVCTVTCGGGTQNRNKVCVEVLLDDSKAQAPESACANLHSVATTQACNQDLCPSYLWVASTWADCNKPCGAGVQTRATTCESSMGGVVNETLCQAATKPAVVQACNTNACTVGQLLWVAGGWGTCSKSCGTGSQSRQLTCQNPSGVSLDLSACASAQLPTATQPCNTQACVEPEWVYCGWEACTAACGGGEGGAGAGTMLGVRTRRAMCVSKAVTRMLLDNSLCASVKKESLVSMGCNAQACTQYNWMTSVWSACVASSVTDMQGTRKRSYHCHGPDGGNALIVDCNQYIKPTEPTSYETCRIDQCVAGPGGVGAGGTTALGEPVGPSIGQGSTQAPVAAESGRVLPSTAVAIAVMFAAFELYIL